MFVNVKYVGICGLDLFRFMVSGLSGNIKYLLILGYEFFGEVVKIGEKVKYINVGDRVVVVLLVFCGKCDYCNEGNFGLCDDYNIIGIRVNGVFVEYVRVLEEYILKLLDILDYEIVVGIELVIIVYYGILKFNIRVGDSVVVLGCGLIG